MDPPQAWAKVSGRYEGCPEDPAKWKTNFRCALRSTHMFVLLEDRSKSGDDPHKVFAIVSDALCHGKKGDFSSPDPVVDQQLLHQQPQLELNPQDVAPEITLTEDAPQEDTLLQPHPDPSQNNCLPPAAFQQWVPPAEQHTFGTYSSPDSMLLEEQGAMALPCHPPEVTVPVPSPGEAMLFAPTASPAPPPPEDNTDGIIPILDVSIYYRGKLFHQEEVGGSQCLLAYQPSDPEVALHPGRLVRFPSPAELADGKQRRFTEKLLGSAGLQLEQRTSKLFATRLKKCKVFWALSQQLEGVGDPPPNPLCRDQETPIFDFNEFCTELRDFRNGQRQRSPDFTIYLCFGQSFSKAKSKESKLILVKEDGAVQGVAATSVSCPLALPITLMVCCCSWYQSSASIGMSRCCGREPPPLTAALSVCSSLTPSASSSSSSSTTCRWTDPHPCHSPWPPGTAGGGPPGLRGHANRQPPQGMPWRDACGADLSSSTPPRPKDSFTGESRS
ncbi:interferon regulatory factor 7 isoform 2-T2 [Morus bassanus]